MVSKRIPKVSIIIPTYNQANLIKSTVESALAQDYENLEVVVADDCSTDNTRHVISSISANDDRVRYFVSSTNLGRVNNYRKALYEYATGDYAINLDGDDLLIDISFVSSAISFFTANPFANLVVACKQYNYPLNVVKKFHKMSELVRSVKGEEFVLAVFSTYQFSHLSTIYQRQKALDMGFYRENIISSDVESILRLALKGDVIVYNKIVGQWNYLGSNESANQSFEASLRNLCWIDNVDSDLASTSLTNISRLFWKIKMMSLYSYPIALSIFGKGGISRAEVRLLFKRHVFVLTSLNFCYLFVKDIKQKVRRHFRRTK